MNEKELEVMFDEAGVDLRHDMLNDARKSNKNTICIAAAVLTKPNGDRRVVTFVPEHGDSDGISSMEEFVEECIRTKSLKAGETVRVEITECSFESMHIAG